MTSTRRTGMLLALVTALVSGVSVLVNSSGVKAFGDATAYTTAKNVVAALVLLAVVGSAGKATLTRPTTRGHWWGLALVGLVGGSLPFVLFFEGLARASAPQAAFLHKTLLIWVAVLAVAFLHERMEWGHWLAIGLLVLGQVGLAGGLPSTLGEAELLILAATLLWSVEVVIAKRLLGSLSSWTVAVARMGIGSVTLLVWVAVKGDLALITSMTGEQAGWVLLTGLLLAAYVGTWLAALARAQAVDVTAVLVLAAPLTATLDAIVHGTALLPEAQWLLLLVAGGLLALRHGWRDQPVLVSVDR